MISRLTNGPNTLTYFNTLYLHWNSWVTVYLIIPIFSLPTLHARPFVQSQVAFVKKFFQQIIGINWSEIKTLCYCYSIRSNNLVLGIVFILSRRFIHRQIISLTIKTFNKYFRFGISISSLNNRFTLSCKSKAVVHR